MKKKSIKKVHCILVFFLFTAPGWNLFADETLSSVLSQAGYSLTSDYCRTHWFPGLCLDTSLPLLDMISAFNAISQPDKTIVEDWDPWNWEINFFNHGGLLASVITFVAGVGLYAGGGALGSTDLNLALVLLSIGVPVNCAGCLLTDIFLQILQHHYKEKGAEIKAMFAPWSWILTGVGLALFAGSVAAPFIEPGYSGAITSVLLGGSAIVINILDLFLVKLEWLKEINTGIWLYNG